MPRAKKTHPVTLRRKELGLSGYELAKKLGIRPSHLHAIESGHVATPGVDLAIRIANELGVDDVRTLFAPTSGKAA